MIKVYKTNHPCIDENPLIIITSGIKDDLVFSEYFIFLNDPPANLPLIQKRMEGSSPMTEDYRLQETIRLVNEELRHHQTKRYIKRKGAIPVEERYELIEDTTGLLAVKRLIRGNNNIQPSLGTINSSTYSEELKKFLDENQGQA